MRKLNNRILLAFAAFAILYAIFYGYQIYFQRNYNAWYEILSKTTAVNGKIISDNERLKIAEIKLEMLEKYLDNGQKNLDAWLKLLALILTLLIGYSVYSGLKSRELAKEELSEIRRIKDDIIRSTYDAEDRLQLLRKQLIEIEDSASRAKNIEKDMALKLQEFTIKEDLSLTQVQLKVLDETINTTKSELQNSGIDAFKNLYFAKALKSYNDKNYDECIRLFNNYIDLEESNGDAYFRRAFAYHQIFIKDKKNVSIADKALIDYAKAKSFAPDRVAIENNIGNLYVIKKEYDAALPHLNEAITINPEYQLAYFNRSIVHSHLGNSEESKRDKAIYEELKLKSEEFPKENV